MNKKNIKLFFTTEYPFIQEEAAAVVPHLTVPWGAYFL
jgi:hypothetical protein